MKTKVRTFNSNTGEELVKLLKEIEDQSEHIAGEEADFKENKAAYLPDWKQFKTDRDMMPIFSIGFPLKNCLDEIMICFPEHIQALYEKEKPIYDMILYGLKGKICTLDFFFKETWSSRKLCYTDSQECISMTKIIIDGDKMTVIAILRSSNRKKLICDILGLYHILIELERLYTEQTEWAPKEKNLQLILCDYQHIASEPACLN